MEKKIVIGTRGSKLALYQAYKVEENIKAKFPDIETHVEIIQTKGDKILDTALSKIGDKGLFTKEIEVALLNNQVDIAVHSLKDLATEIPEGLKLGAVLKRGEYRDALVHKNNKKLHELTAEDIIATSSLRRRAALRMLNQDVQIIDIRGNVNTRLTKMEDGHCDGMIMAAAGLIRLGLEKYITEIIEPDQILPAVSQGTIAIESRKDDSFTDKILKKINHKETYIGVAAERSFMKTLQGGCQVPVGAISVVMDDMIEIKGFVSSLDGKEFIVEKIVGMAREPERVGKMLALQIIEKGGNEILDKIRHA